MEGELAISDIIPTNYCIRFGHAYPRTSYQRERLNYQIIKQFCKVLKCDLFPPIRYVAKFSVTLFVSVRVIVHWQHSRLNYSFKGKAMMKQHQETFKERILKLKIAIYIKRILPSLSSQFPQHGEASAQNLRDVERWERNFIHLDELDLPDSLEWTSRQENFVG